MKRDILLKQMFRELLQSYSSAKQSNLGYYFKEKLEGPNRTEKSHSDLKTTQNYLSSEVRLFGESSWYLQDAEEVFCGEEVPLPNLFLTNQDFLFFHNSFLNLLTMEGLLNSEVIIQDWNSLRVKEYLSILDDCVPTIT